MVVYFFVVVFAYAKNHVFFVFEIFLSIQKIEIIRNPPSLDALERTVGTVESLTCHSTITYTCRKPCDRRLRSGSRDFSEAGVAHSLRLRPITQGMERGALIAENKATRTAVVAAVRPAKGSVAEVAVGGVAILLPLNVRIGDATRGRGCSCASFDLCKNPCLVTHKGGSLFGGQRVQQCIYARLNMTGPGVATRGAPRLGDRVLQGTP